MDRTEFESLRDLPGKYIDGDVDLVTTARTGVWRMAGDVPIANDLGTTLLLNVAYNPEIGTFKCNVHVTGLGPICRLEIDGTEHPGKGRTHKHHLVTARCPRQNLHQGVDARPDLSGASPYHAWRTFCAMAGIDHRGTLLIEGAPVVPL